ncbi:hypothetical protein DL98DRAFT_599627 [Cadophora sp. DSE1049]|nr:hypothetical protein DL98DRAFT_599627 [Cadophora sp. DSE1049]
MSFDNLIALSLLVQPRSSTPVSNVVTSAEPEPVPSVSQDLRAPVQDPHPPGIQVDVDKAPLTISPALLTERTICSEATSSDMITTPRSTENQSLALESPPHLDQFAEHSVELPPIPGVYPNLGGDAQTYNTGNMNLPADWFWPELDNGLQNGLQNGSSQAEPWNGVGCPDPTQAQ